MFNCGYRIVVIRLLAMQETAVRFRLPTLKFVVSYDRYYMELAFREWVEEQEVDEDFRGLMQKAQKAIPKSPRELFYSMFVFPPKSPMDQKRRGYWFGKHAGEYDLTHGTNTENPYRNPQGEIDPAADNFFKGWEIGYAAAKKGIAAVPS